MYAIIVLVIIQLSDNFQLSIFDCGGSTLAKDSLITFSLWPIITYEYYSLFVYLYSSEVGNNDFCAFTFLSNQLLEQTMHVFIV